MANFFRFSQKQITNWSSRKIFLGQKMETKTKTNFSLTQQRKKTTYFLTKENEIYYFFH